MSEHPAVVSILEPGQMLDRYELLSVIARGGMANVWLARFKGKHGFEKLVAIKTILPEHAADRRFQRMFLDEARIASRIEHAHVAQILDLGEWYDTLYLVMEYVDGDSLSRLRRTLDRKNQKIPLPIALRILSDVCGGLHAAHELKGPGGQLLNVVHRDVSPQNVLISEAGAAKLIDFGVVKARGRLEETNSGLTKGKSRYMAPEQAHGTEIDRRADIFAVGAMAYEIFVGSAPYDGPNDIARIQALLTGPDITQVPGAPHPAIEKVILKALSRDPAKRYATAAELAKAFEDVIVALRVRASHEDIAAFVAKHMETRIAERKRFIQLALDAAAERQRLREMLEQGSIARKSQRNHPDIAEQSSSDSDIDVGAKQPIIVPPAAVSDPSIASQQEAPQPSARERTSTTYASTVSDPPATVEPPKKTVTPLWLALGGIACVVLGGIIVLAMRPSPPEKQTAAVSNPQPQAAPSATETVVVSPPTPSVAATSSAPAATATASAPVVSPTKATEQAAATATTAPSVVPTIKATTQPTPVATTRPTSTGKRRNVVIQ